MTQQHDQANSAGRSTKQQPASAAPEPVLDEIPMSKAKPTTIFAIVGVIAAIGGVVAVTTLRGQATEEQAAEMQTNKQQSDDEDLSSEEYREHIQATQAALEKLRAEEEAAQQAAAAKQGEAQADKQADGTPAGASKGSGAPPKRPVSKGQAKKQLDSLDNMGSDIASQLE